jgi:hypothetical protein
MSDNQNRLATPTAQELLHLTPLYGYYDVEELAAAFEELRGPEFVSSHVRLDEYGRLDRMHLMGAGMRVTERDLGDDHLGRSFQGSEDWEILIHRDLAPITADFVIGHEAAHGLISAALYNGRMPGFLNGGDISETLQHIRKESVCDYAGSVVIGHEMVQDVEALDLAWLETHAA